MNRKPARARLSFVRFAATAFVLLFGVMALPAWASDPQLQAQVNALQQTVNTQAGQIAALQTTITKLQNYVNPLANVLTYDSTHKLVQLTGVNLRVVNGVGTTPTVNGLGNVIIGYNEDDGDARGACTFAFDTTESACAADGGTFTRTLSGSHNLVIGSGHGFSQYGGMAVGQDNLISGPFAVVSGGMLNTASGSQSSVSGGSGNFASGNYSSVSGGIINAAGGNYSSVSGGFSNNASGSQSSVSGGSGITESSLNGWAAGGTNTPAFHSP